MAVKAFLKKVHSCLQITLSNTWSNQPQVETDDSQVSRLYSSAISRLLIRSGHKESYRLIKIQTQTPSRYHTRKTKIKQPPQLKKYQTPTFLTTMSTKSNWITMMP